MKGSTAIILKLNTITITFKKLPLSISRLSRSLSSRHYASRLSAGVSFHRLL